MKKVHFIGIGGIGMSALARYYFSNGWEVSGSDNSENEVTRSLEDLGIKVFIGQQVKENIAEDVTKIIYTIAVGEDNQELIKAKQLEKEKNISLLTYPQALGEMTRNKNVIAVCGTHGKTTTTALTYYALKNAGVDVSMIVGSMIDVDGRKTNYVHGDSSWIVIEACEYKRSFLNYNPNIILLTNIDNDHLDYFKDEQDIKNAFQEFVEKIKSPPTPLKGGENSTAALIIHTNEKYLKTPEDIKKISCEEIISENEIELSVPGIHNRKNAQLVVALGEFLNLDKNKILEGLKNFKGTWRRQEYKGNFFGAEFYDDYAHHPTEIRATLQAFREKYPSKKILAIFQPHLYSRTKLLFADFAKSFTDADEVFILPIYAAREKPDASIDSEMLAQEIVSNGRGAVLVEKENIVENLKNTDLSGSVVITLGAGDIYDIYTKISEFNVGNTNQTKN